MALRPGLPCLWAVATAMLGSEALEERPCSKVLWKVLEQAGLGKWSCVAAALGELF